MKIATDSLEEARILLDRSYPGITVRPGAGEDFHIALETDFLDSVVTHQLATRTGVNFCVPERSDAYMLAALDDGRLDIEVGRRWHARLAPALVVVDATRVSTWRWHPGSYEIVLVTAECLHARLAQWLERPVVQRIRFDLEAPADQRVIRLTREIVRVARLLTALDGEPGGSPREVLKHLLDAAMCALLQVVPHNYSSYLARRRSGPSPKHIRRAIDFIHANAQASITIVDIANASHVSVRGLQAGFAKFQGLTPMAYLRQVRLEGALADLRAAAPAQTIAEVARRWRFCHAGQFALDFRKAFGMSPSEARSQVHASAAAG
ncbi:hypothetical protein BKK81_10390 [Cupriavidus sp. USMAHM13]|uniref:helix-turn-helix transcriptional regulator n=1 Tax=Cupriavidus sp. USMAHM13 TaxID=1389192 RepID=UPI0008A6D2D4|nr:helix-turn-helix domain-containing protein [Cupriavidus sp. USMAHM13]AOY99623.1 hypothetical protein BKK81_10390 [Cupriavidus sp. USMAHM13]